MSDRFSSPRLTAAVAAAALTLTGCGDGRSVEAYCEVMEEHKARYLESFEDAEQAAADGSLEGVLSALEGGIGAVGDLRQMWEELAEVAPEEIREDVDAVRDSYDRQLDSAGDAAADPLGALAGSVMDGLLSSGSWRRVNDWTAENCG